MALPENASDQAPDNTMKHILQEIMAVSQRMEDMDFNISVLTAATKFICSDIARFRKRMASLELRITSDRSRRENVCFFGIPECMEGPVMKSFLRTTLPAFTGFNLIFHYNSIAWAQHAKTALRDLVPSLPASRDKNRHGSSLPQLAHMDPTHTRDTNMHSHRLFLENQ
ncbi:hypothetical protein NDU88_007696 [Pleurodeles waltl]|uniref:Uncharacterized protein n=1 Tax=Pleurodeles waltl TaxID=8319 RepID=A0AAV7PQ37_PLEWA|nr:hypothetical protein NDU88_007694 [Pleurodeles waltl]KAJ1129324.1 hypothetical protein NDU88_007695 [Pleurodeles waltl]KAJ1129325.1 hypothetical protein NDU88_007696 [Pleurodeles waltl]